MQEHILLVRTFQNERVWAKTPTTDKKFDVAGL
jgi:hypothetical protein